MNYHDFIGSVQHRAHLSDLGEAAEATRVVLQTLGARLGRNERQHLAVQLPGEIARHLDQAGVQQTLDLEEFYWRVSSEEGCDFVDAIHHSRAVVSVLGEAVSGGEAVDMMEQLPSEYAYLFEHQWEEQ